ncbi:MAG: hypothetical protein WBA57_04080 [Elainellaceae cyanobacterium]
MPLIQRTWRTVLDRLYYFREGVSTFITFISLHIYASEITWSEIKKGKIRSTKQVDLKLDDAKELDLLLSEVKCRLAEAEERRNSTTDKCKSLVTLSSLVLAASGIVVSKTSLDSTWAQVILVLVALLLIHVVILISMHFAVGADMQPTVDQHDASLSGDDLRKSLINTYLKCQADRNDRVNFLVEVYKGARFYFLLGLTLIIILLVSTFPTSPKEDVASTVAKQLAENTPFIERLSERIAVINDNPERQAATPGNTACTLFSESKSTSAVEPPTEPSIMATPLSSNEPPSATHEVVETPDQNRTTPQTP